MLEMSIGLHLGSHQVRRELEIDGIDDKADMRQRRIGDHDDRDPTAAMASLVIRFFILAICTGTKFPSR